MLRPSFRRLILAIAALAVSVTAVLPGLVALVRWPDFPVLAFSVDDGLYLQRAIGACEGDDTYEWTYAETPRAPSLGESALLRPNAVVDIAVGCAARELGLSPGHLAVLLDLLCCWATLLAFTAIFGLWAPAAQAFAAAIVATLLPHWLLPEPRLLLPTQGLPFLVNQPLLDHSSAALRAVYTQLSYPAYLLLLFLLLRDAVRDRLRPPRLLLLGVGAGLLGHGYFFPWLAAAAVGAILPWLALLADRRQSLRDALLRCAAYGSGWFLGSLGSFWILARNRSGGIVADARLGHLFFVPIEQLLVGLLILLWALRERQQGRRPSLLPLLVAGLLLLELPLMNLQPLTRQGLAPYHFASFYLLPIASGGVFLLLLQLLRRLGFSLLLAALLLLPPLVVTMHAAQEVRLDLQEDPYAEDLSWLVRRLRKTAPESVFALDPVPVSSLDSQGGASHELPVRNLPNFLTLLSGRHTLYQDWMFNEVADDSDLRRELLTGWLLGRPPGLLWQQDGPVSMTDVFTYTEGYLRLRREQKVAMHGAMLRSFDVCQALREFRVDLLVHEAANDGALPDAGSRGLTLLARSPHASFSIYRFDRAAMLERLCGGDAAPAGGA